jgi:hypothetical protein
MIGPKQLEILEYLNSFGSRITSDAKRKCEIKSRTAMEHVAFNKNKTVFINKLDLNLRKKLTRFRTVLY